MRGKRLLVFNPEHDLALAVGNKSYTPPPQVVALRKEKSLLPALYADDGDSILLTDNLSPTEISSLPYHDVALEKELDIITLKELQSRNLYIEKIIPWGWDHAIKKLLKENAVPEALLPTEEYLDKIRELSHRRTSIKARELISKFLKEPIFNAPKELPSEEEVEKFLEVYPLSYFKAPWSSSGRGLVVSDHITRKGLLEWTHGVIKKQGSVIGEPKWNRKLDFATEWEIKGGIPIFLGYSVFETSSRGKYHGNIFGSQRELLGIIKRNAPNFGDWMIDVQYNAIQEIISPHYEGYLGIDMFSDIEGRINPCVEINLRLTMGHVFLNFGKNF